MKRTASLLVVLMSALAGIGCGKKSSSTFSPTSGVTPLKVKEGVETIQSQHMKDVDDKTKVIEEK
jgi:hypothetical protein